MEIDSPLSKIKLKSHQTKVRILYVTPQLETICMSLLIAINPMYRAEHKISEKNIISIFELN